MVDFPGDESLMTCGLDAWPFATKDCPDEWRVIEERLQNRLGVDHFRLPPDYRTVGPGIAHPHQRIPFVRFPRWHYCPRCGNMQEPTLFGGLQRCDGPPWREGMSCHDMADYRRPRLLPVRFVAICRDKGHIQDFPFMEWVHRTTAPATSCRLRLRAGRSAAGLAGIRIQCLCGQSASMSNVFNEGSLDKITACCGHRPWLGEIDGKAGACGASLRVVQRGASNTYFPHVASSIYLPLWGENARRSIVEAIEDSTIWDYLVSGVEDGKIMLKRCADVCALKPHLGLTSEELREVAQKRLDGATGDVQTVSQSHGLSLHAEEERYRFDEYEAMRTGRTVQPELEMERRSGSEYEMPIRDFFKTVTLVKKLRETRALYGFSRYLPDDSRTPREQIESLRLDNAINWLPAVVTRGEGIFFELDDARLRKWLSHPEAMQRTISLTEQYNHVRRVRQHPARNLSPKFVMIHTLAHLLINQLSFDCGYGSSSLRERIYCDADFPEHPMQGFLIYTASGDAEGTMGGLVRQGQPGRVEETLYRALRKACWCSYDPVCMESGGQGPDSCNNAACHGCAILPETSCEEGNRLLDRAVVVGRPESPTTGLFGEYIEQVLTGEGHE